MLCRFWLLLFLFLCAKATEWNTQQPCIDTVNAVAECIVSEKAFQAGSLESIDEEPAAHWSGPEAVWFPRARGTGIILILAPSADDYQDAAQHASRAGAVLCPPFLGRQAEAEADKYAGRCRTELLWGMEKLYDSVDIAL